MIKHSFIKYSNSLYKFYFFYLSIFFKKKKIILCKIQLLEIRNIFKNRLLKVFFYFFK
jgi:hypothetical protein